MEAFDPAAAVQHWHESANRRNVRGSRKVDEEEVEMELEEDQEEEEYVPPPLHELNLLLGGEEESVDAVEPVAVADPVQEMQLQSSSDDELEEDSDF